MKSIIVKNVSKKYKQAQALDNISVVVEKGEIFGLIGPDGAGKTSLMRILSTLILPTSGEAYLEGLNCARDYKKIRKIIGYMPGKFSLYHDLSVEENLNFFASVFGTTVRENYDLVKLIYAQIEPFKKRRAGKLSGGMKQKLALSCALIHYPKVLILDEPTTGVDAVSRKEFWQILKTLKERGITILVSTPYMDEAELCDRVGLIQGGKMMSVNLPSEIIKEFHHELFALTSENNYRLMKHLKERTNPHDVQIFGQNIHLINRKAKLSIEVLKQDLINNGFPNISISKIQPGIEDCFIELMRGTSD
ncbi:MAG: ABC transporter ATP-binding protein [Candidatus Marinimicrobia bacterium]|nr:ABC transporter ATP-binding protein [Candidatus Neomarinimicrobiota bacterium]